jgi:hypothetical protein
MLHSVGSFVALNLLNSIFFRPLVHCILYLDVRGKSVNVVIWSPEELSEVRGTLQLVLDTHHVFVKIAYQVSSIFLLLKEVILKSLHMGRVRPRLCVDLRHAHAGTSGVVKLVPSLIPVLDKFHLFITF